MNSNNPMNSTKKPFPATLRTRLAFSNYSLRTKLVIAFLLVALIPIGSVFYRNDQETTKDLWYGADTSVKAAAGQGAAALDNFLTSGLNDVRTAALLNSWQGYLALSASARKGSPAEAAVYNDLRALARRDPVNITSVGLVDAAGIAVADTSLPEIGVDKSKREYFIGPLQTKLPYVSPVNYSLVSGGPSIYFSALIRDARGTVIGVLRVRYNAVVLQSILKNSADKSNINSLSLVLFDENHMRLADTVQPDLNFKALVPLSPDKVVQLISDRRLPTDQPVKDFTTNNQGFEQSLNNLTNHPFFVTEFHKGSGNDQGTAVGVLNEPWLVAAGQNQQVFLAPIRAQTSSELLTILVMVLIVAAAGLVFFQTLA